MFVYTPNNTYEASYLLAGYSVTNKNYRRSFIRFNIPELSNCDIVRGELLLTTLACENGNTSEVQQVGVYQLLEPFGNTTLWNTCPQMKMPGCIETVSHFDAEYTWDITSMVKQWFQNPKSNYGVAILVENIQEGVESAKNFHSRRSPQHNRSPKLKIYYKNE